MIAQVRQVDLEQLLEKLENLRHKVFIECVERHYGVLEHQVREVHERLVLVLDVQQHDGRDVAHALHVPDVGSVHGEGAQYPEERVVVLHAFLEETQVRERPLDILLDQRDRFLSLLDGIARTINLDEHEKLLPDLIVLEIEFFKNLGVVLRLLLLALRCVSVQLRALLIATGLGLALLQMLYLLFNISRRTSVLDYLILNLLVLIKELAQFAAPLGHNVEERFRNHTLIADGAVPNDGSDSLWYAFGPELAALGG